MSHKSKSYKKTGNKKFSENWDYTFKKEEEMPKKKEQPKKQRPKKRGSKSKKSY